jgi:hypothetical protein
LEAQSERKMKKVLFVALLTLALPVGAPANASAFKGTCTADGKGGVVHVYTIPADEHHLFDQLDNGTKVEVFDRYKVRNDWWFWLGPSIATDLQIP